MNIFNSFGIVILPAIIVFIIFLVVACIIVKKHENFIDYAEKIVQGMTFEEVESIMKISPTSIEDTNDTRIVIWEKRQWVGIAHGGTLIRAVKVTFKNNIVISIAKTNLNKEP